MYHNIPSKWASCWFVILHPLPRIPIVKLLVLALHPPLSSLLKMPYDPNKYFRIYILRNIFCQSLRQKSLNWFSCPNHRTISGKFHNKDDDAAQSCDISNKSEGCALHYWYSFIILVLVYNGLTKQNDLFCLFLKPWCFLNPGIR